MTHAYKVGECPGFAPGMALPFGVCENCGGDRELDHAPALRNASKHWVPQPLESHRGLSRDQLVQGVRTPYPTIREYPCGCVATGGSGYEPLPEWCPTHQQPVVDAHEKVVKGG